MNPNQACFSAFIFTLLLILCVFCLSTPLIATNYVHLIFVEIGIVKEDEDVEINKNPSQRDWIRWHLVCFIFLFVYSLLLFLYYQVDNINLILASLLDKYVPLLSIQIQKFVPRITKSSKDHRLLQTSYMVLFFTGFIAPSTGLLS